MINVRPGCLRRSVAHSFPAIFGNILRVLPDIKTRGRCERQLADERLWLAEMRRDGPLHKPGFNRIVQ